MKKIKIAYIGGGSKQWARVFMNDLALSKNITGEIGLYDIDIEAAIRNQKIGNYINQNPNTISKWNYVVYKELKDALTSADFVVMSILPATFKEMASDVHAPEKYGIYQAVGDTVGPGGILRAMRTVPLYEGFAKAIKEYCPDAWVINFTNPMSICTKTLYDVYPEIKAFGCCHEVFHAQDFLCLVLHEEMGIERPNRKEIYTDACGINHFTWITEAYYKDINILSYLPGFIKKYYNEGYYERIGADKDAFKRDCFAYGNKVKMDLFNKYHCLAAAGDRHLVEFLNNSWYLNDKTDPEKWLYQLTTVDYRVNQCNKLIEESNLMASGEKPVIVQKSDEEAVDLIEALLGFKTIVTNVNYPNKGQMSQLPINSIVETNCVFTNNSLKPITSKELPIDVLNLVSRNNTNIETSYLGIKNRDLNMIFNSFINQPLTSSLTYSDGLKLFKEMINNTYEYLSPFFPNLDKFLNNK